MYVQMSEDMIAQLLNATSKMEVGTQFTLAEAQQWVANHGDVPNKKSLALKLNAMKTAKKVQELDAKAGRPEAVWEITTPEREAELKAKKGAEWAAMTAAQEESRKRYRLKKAIRDDEKEEKRKAESIAKKQRDMEALNEVPVRSGVAKPSAAVIQVTTTLEESGVTIQGEAGAVGELLRAWQNWVAFKQRGAERR